MIPDDFIQNLLGRVDIVDIVERHLPLRKAGANYVACCPFHQEKTPSFTVSQSKQFYHCFGCGAHGTAIGFLMAHSGASFVEAVEDLAERMGMQVPQVAGTSGSGATHAGPDLRETLLVAARFYKSRLKESPRAVAYLRGRGLTGEVAARFGIGYAPAGWQALAEVFPEYDAPALEAAGLVIVGDQGRRYDRFRDRIMFPILDTRGEVIGFGGRVLDQGEPKYLNSPETPIFSKGRELYGLTQARRAIREAGRILVVEGYMDVVALAQFGVAYAVATLGTSTTPVHAQKLFRQAEQIVFCFDGDAAGRKAAWRALENTLPSLVDGKNVAFLFLPEGEDPDTYVRNQGAEAFEQLLTRQSLPLSDYLLQELASRHPTVSSEGRAALLKAAEPYLAQIGAPVLAGLLRRRLIELVGLTAEDAAAMLPSLRAGPRREAPARPRPRAKVSLELSVLKCLLARPELISLCDWPPTEDPAPEAQALARVVQALRQHVEAGPSTAALLQWVGEGPGQNVLERALGLIQEEELAPEAVEVEMRSSVARYKELDEEAAVAALLKGRSLASLSPAEQERVRSSLARPGAGGGAA
jgi:DNA primase